MAWLVVAMARAEDPKTAMTKLGKIVLQDDFTVSTDAGWRKAKGKFDIEGGFLRVAEVKSDMHAAAMRFTPATPLERAVFQYSFKLDGAKQTSLSLNSSQGHLSRVVISPTTLSVRKDSSDKNKTDKAAVLDTVKVDLKPAEWHTIVVELSGPEMLATLDGKTTAYGKLDGIDRPKANFGLTVSGESVGFKGLRVWAAEPNPTWEQTRQQLLDSRSKNK
jgi:hypothetical protein